MHFVSEIVEPHGGVPLTSDVRLKIDSVDIPLLIFDNRRYG